MIIERAKKKDDIKTVETLKLAMKEELVPYLDGIMTLVQRGKARRSREEAFIDLMNCDDIITKYSQKYKVRLYSCGNMVLKVSTIF